MSKRRFVSADEWWWIYEIHDDDGSFSDDELIDVPDDLLAEYIEALTAFTNVQKKIAVLMGETDFRMPGWGVPQPLDVRPALYDAIERD
jgi:hypothetical protein